MEEADRRLGELIQRADPDELLLEIDRRCARGDWDGLIDLRDRCDAAVELGRQLWPVARYAEYRLALEGPGRHAAGVCRARPGRFTLGPLTEVAASTHGWDELADHLAAPWVAATVAQERVLRGEDLRGDDRAHAEELDLPLVLEPWEPHYHLPTYRSHELLEGGPAPVEGGFEEPDVSGGRPVDRPDLERAMADIGRTWSEASNGSCRVAVVAGDAAAAAVTLLSGPVGIVRIELSEAIARLAWTAASGGAYGRRPGMAAGRSAFWWLAHTATGLAFPAEPSELGERLAALRWYVVAGAVGEWSLRLAFEDPEGGWGAAVDAWDRRRGGESDA